MSTYPHKKILFQTKCGLSRKTGTRALTWTTEPPKVAGWYWCRPSKLNMPRCVEVYGAWEQLMFGSKRDDFNPQVPVTREGFEWAGPIPTPLEPGES